MKATFLLFLRGMLMGMADLVPGVSGGTIAFITGIYQRLVHSLSEFTSFFHRKWEKTFRKLDWALFIPLGLGILFSLYVFSGVIDVLLTEYTGISFAFFFGLIAASALYIYTHIGKLKYEHFIVASLGFIVSYLITGASATQVTPSVLFLVFGGAIAICALLLPGISGAFILLLFGLYEYVITAIHDLQFRVLLPFALGALMGLLAFSKVLDYLIKRYTSLTFAFLIGLMVGSLRIPWEKIVSSETSVLLLFLFGLFGFTLVLLLEVVFNKKRRK
jgi:putative membrane protein